MRSASEAELAPGPNVLRVSLPSDTAFLHLVTNLARNAGAAAGLSEQEAGRLALATDEAVTNVIEHAYHGRKDGRIDVVIRLLDGGVEIHVIHDGDAIDETRLPSELDLASKIRQGQRGGLGLFLIRRLVDRVAFGVTADRRNDCCLVKARRGAAGEGAAHGR